ncbi:MULTISPECIES: hypothetical protein [unclassified Thiocapsa]|uniref:hypothetical protein n=1 Tax=unclassified Thiocapsa TaxID=2641286 RepID=UPI0035B15558
MQALILFFVELCALRRTPQDLPASEILLAVVALASLVVGVMIGLVAGLSIGASLAQTLFELAMTLGALFVALRLMRLDARFFQSATALLGSGVVIGAIALIPLSFNPTDSQETDLAALGALLLLVVFVWSVVVSGHILRHTFQITLGQGAAIAVAFKVGVVLLMGIAVGGA